MARELQFGFESKRQRLIVSAPIEIASEAMTTAAEKHAGQNISRRRLFDPTVHPDEIISYGFNARKVGTLPGPVKRNTLAYVNDFIGTLVGFADEGRVRHDPRLALTAYRPLCDETGFDFRADVARPNEDTTVLALGVGACVTRMAHQLQLYPDRELADYQRILRGDIDLEGEGVALKIGFRSTVSTPPDAWSPTADRFELTGNNVLTGEQPLIFLAGAVALAHADEL
ncbi:MAG: hypothetical protein WA843_02520 [Candidatus Saccharimonadales bacterium]